MSQTITIEELEQIYNNFLPKLISAAQLPVIAFYGEIEKHIKSTTTTTYTAQDMCELIKYIFRTYVDADNEGQRKTTAQLLEAFKAE